MEAYVDLRVGFLECHKSETNTLLHIITGVLGIIGVLSFMRAVSRRFTPVTLAVILYGAALLGSSAPLPVVAVVVASLAVVVVPLVKVAALGECSDLHSLIEQVCMMSRTIWSIYSQNRFQGQLSIFTTMCVL